MDSKKPLPYTSNGGKPLDSLTGASHSQPERSSAPECGSVRTESELAAAVPAASPLIHHSEPEPEQPSPPIGIIRRDKYLLVDVFLGDQIVSELRVRLDANLLTIEGQLDEPPSQPAEALPRPTRHLLRIVVLPRRQITDARAVLRQGVLSIKLRWAAGRPKLGVPDALVTADEPAMAAAPAPDSLVIPIIRSNVSGCCGKSNCNDPLKRSLT